MDDKEPIQLTKAELDHIIRDSVLETLLRMGINAKDPQDMVELQRDFQHLRDWRRTTDAVKSKGVMTLTVTLIAGVCALVWMTLTGDKP